VHEHVAEPVFIFLPLADPSPDRDTDGPVIDPVCGRALRDEAIAGRLLHEGRYHYFCALRCAEQFASEAGELDSR